MNSSVPVHRPVLALLGGEGLRPESSSLWRRLIDLAGTETSEIAVLPSGLASLPRSQMERRQQTTRTALEGMGLTVRIVSPEDRITEGMLYLSGGDQRAVIDQLRGSLVWESVTAQGASLRLLAASGAAAVALGEQAFVPVRPYPAGLSNLDFDVLPGLSFLRGLMIVPYFGWLQDEVIHKIICLAAQCLVIGIDDQAALIAHSDQWEVAGHGTVTIVNAGAPPHVYDSGAQIPVEQLAPYPQR